MTRSSRTADWAARIAVPVAVFALIFPQWQQDQERERDAADACRLRNTQLRDVLLRDDALLRGVNEYAGDSEGSRKLEAAIRAEWDELHVTYRDCNGDDIVGNDRDFLP